MSRKSDSQVGILEACWDRLRPIKERKVGASGTKGVGCGIGWGGMRACRARVRVGVVVVVRREVVARWAGRANIVVVVGWL